MSVLDFERAAAQADLCRLLAACYYEPGPEFAEERLFDSIVDTARRIDSVLAAGAEQFRTAFASESTDVLLVDYAHLFLGPVGTLAQPYESAWLNKESEAAMDSTQALLELFADGGFEVDEQFRDLPDHIAVELEFLYTLRFRIAAAVAGGDQAAIDGARALQWNLLEQHLGLWLGDFRQAVEAGAECRFYRELVDLTARFVAAIRSE
jgi:TorA maturation chaperone TorD